MYVITSYARGWAVLAVLTVVISLLFGCGPKQFVDATEQVVGNQEILPAPEPELMDVAWLDDEHIAFITRYRRGDYRVALYSLTTKTWRDIVKMPINEHCHPGSSFLTFLNRLPNGNLGYAHHCTRDGPSGFLYEWNKETERSEVLQFYDPFAIGPYAFSPDMTQLIQEESVGVGLDNDLYRINRDGEMQKLFPDFQRVSHPSWSPDGKIIAFAGTDRFPHGDSEEFSQWREIEAGLRHPWDIYLMDADGDNVRVLLPSVGLVGEIKWQPTRSRTLAFAGNPHNTVGVWVLDVDSLGLTRVWSSADPYDWSPDGNSMVFIVSEDEVELTGTYPVIVDVPVE